MMKTALLPVPHLDRSCLTVTEMVEQFAARLRNGGAADLAARLEQPLSDEAAGWERMWRRAMEERDKANELTAFAGVKLNEALQQRNDLASVLREVLACNQLLRDARLTKSKDNELIQARTGGLAHAEREAREVLAALTAG